MECCGLLFRLVRERSLEGKPRDTAMALKRKRSELHVSSHAVDGSDGEIEDPVIGIV